MDFDQSRRSVLAPEDAALIFHQLVGEADRESLVALYLNVRHVVTHAHIVSRGHLSGSAVHPREIFKGALLANASAVIIGHNHPSGDVHPSAADREARDRLEQAGELLGLEVLDFLIVGPARRFYATSTQAVEPLPGESLKSAVRHQVASDAVKVIQGLQQDIAEVLERMGEEWWDETVTSGVFHRGEADKFLS